MTEDRIKKIAIGLIGNNQDKTDIDADKEIYVYTVAYNDGVLDLMRALIEEESIIKADKVESEDK